MSGRQSSENKPYFDDEREDAAIMSREWKEPNATWQKPNDLSLDVLPQEDAPPFSYEEDEVAAISNPPPMPPEDFAMDESLEPEPEPFITRSEALRNFGQQISPILVPLLFGGLTFLFIAGSQRSLLLACRTSLAGSPCPHCPGGLAGHVALLCWLKQRLLVAWHRRRLLPLSPRWLLCGLWTSSYRYPLCRAPDC